MLGIPEEDGAMLNEGFSTDQVIGKSKGERRTDWLAMLSALGDWARARRGRAGVGLGRVVGVGVLPWPGRRAGCKGRNWAATGRGETANFRSGLLRPCEAASGSNSRRSFPYWVPPSSKNQWWEMKQKLPQQKISFRSSSAEYAVFLTATFISQNLGCCPILQAGQCRPDQCRQGQCQFEFPTFVTR